MELNEIMNGAGSLSIAVIGDVCLDLYYHSHQSDELSVETGLPVEHVTTFTPSLGGAAQVALQCKKLGCKRVDLIGVIGEDMYGKEITRLLDTHAISKEFLVTQQEKWDTHVYHKMIEGKTEVTRYDIGSNNSLSPTSEDTIIASLQKESTRTWDVIIINQQQTIGLHTPSFISRLQTLIEQSNHETMWLSDVRNIHKSYPSTIHKMNIHEAQKIAQELHLDSTPPSPQTLSASLAHYWNIPVIITLGEYGSVAHDTRNLYRENGVHIIKEVDPVGAGDAFISGLAVALGAKSSFKEALHLANIASSVHIQPFLFPHGLTPQAIIELGTHTDYSYNYEIAQDIQKAHYLQNSDIEIINKDMRPSKEKKYPQYAIFDLDGTISALREGWDSIMKESMLSFISGPHYSSLTSSELKSLGDTIDVLIKKTTGVQTIIQMVEMCDLSRELGYAPPSQMLTPYEYKELYAEKIRKAVKKKIERYKAGLLSLEDLTIKGAIPFLIKLREKGVTLYLASGTDQTDVMSELKEFGYDILFNGGIFGSVGDTENDPKKLVMRTIKDEILKTGNELKRGDCVVFGDGPVEIREGRKQEFITVGINSDEKQRYGMNEKKRERLILAGADFLMPDYSWATQLALLLGWE